MLYRLQTRCAVLVASCCYQKSIAFVTIEHNRLRTTGNREGDYRNDNRTMKPEWIVWKCRQRQRTMCPVVIAVVVDSQCSLCVAARLSCRGYTETTRRRRPLSLKYLSLVGCRQLRAIITVHCTGVHEAALRKNKIGVRFVYLYRYIICPTLEYD